MAGAGEFLPESGGGVGPWGRVSLGWRFGLVTVVSVTLVVGGLTYVQQRREIARERAALVTMLDQAVGPLVTRVEASSSLPEIEGRLIRFVEERERRGDATARLVLRDGAGVELASSDPDLTAPEWAGEADPGVLHARLPVFSPVLPGGQGTLSVLQDAPSFEAAITARWRSWLLEMLVMIVAVVASVAVVNHFVVTRPLHRLEDGVRQMGIGYLGALKSMQGAPEWRRLAQGIWRLGTDLERTVRSLVEAERRALGGAGDSGVAPDGVGRVRTVDGVGPAGPFAPVEAVPATSDLARRYLRDKCRLLETQNPNDPVVQAHALEAWENDLLLAERTGDNVLRSRLDDAAFRVLHPDDYETVMRFARSVVVSPPTWLRNRETEMRAALAEGGVRVVEFQRRAKHAAGIWRKANLLGLPVDQLYDIFGFRVIVGDERDCYRALDVLHRRFEPQLLSFKDYIARPKPSGYRSLHTHLRSTDGLLFEVQIRTPGMHEVASGDQGAAAHWRYKSTQAAGATGAGRKLGRWWDRARAAIGG